jgi:ABC-2 type transport system permease protein
MAESSVASRPPHPATRASESWRSFRMATWLGWQIESNWTDPFLFAVYSIVKPLSGAAILVVMYGVITLGNYDNPMFPYIYLGNAFYIYVGAVMTGVSWAVVDDREHYKTLKYMYIAPINIPLYLLGRGVARFITGSIAVIITITAGVLFLKVPLNLAEVDWLLFIVTLLLGVVMLALLGLLLAGVTLIVARHEGFIGEATAGALYIFSGAVFPLDILPAWIRPVGFFMPTTYWLELLRRSLVGDVAQAFPTLSAFSNLHLLGILLGLSIVFGVVGVLVFRHCDRIARERGLIDRTTNY